MFLRLEPVWWVPCFLVGGSHRPWKGINSPFVIRVMDTFQELGELRKVTKVTGGCGFESSCQCLIGDFWLVVGCWLQLWLELWSVVVIALLQAQPVFRKSPTASHGYVGSRISVFNANPRKSNHSYLRLLQASPAILLAWFTSNPKFSTRFCRKISSGSPLSLHRYGTRCGYDWGDFVCHVPKLCAQTKGFHLNFFHCNAVNALFTCFLIFVSWKVMWRLILFVKSSGWLLDHPDWMEGIKRITCAGV